MKDVVLEAIKYREQQEYGSASQAQADRDLAQRQETINYEVVIQSGENKYGEGNKFYLDGEL